MPVIDATLRFPASSVMYLMQQADCLQTRNHPSSRLIEFPRSLNGDDMVRKLNEITGETLTRDDLARLTAKFKEFSNEFAKQAGIRRPT